MTVQLTFKTKLIDIKLFVVKSSETNNNEVVCSDYFFGEGMYCFLYFFSKTGQSKFLSETQESFH